MTDNTTTEGQTAASGAQATTQPVQPIQETVSNKAWFETLPDEDKRYIKNKGWDKAEGTKDMLTSYKNLEKLRGVPENELIRLPKEDDKDSWQKVYSRLGRPEKIEGYNYIPPEGQEVDTNRINKALAKAHELGLNPTQISGLINDTLKYESELIKDFNEKSEQETVIGLDALKKRWGAAYDERIELGKRAFRQFGSNEASDSLEKIVGAPAVIEMFAKIGESISEGKMVGTEGRAFGYSPEQAKADKQALLSELSSPVNRERLTAYNHGKGPDYEKMQRLLQIEFSGSSAKKQA